MVSKSSRPYRFDDVEEERREVRAQKQQKRQERELERTLRNIKNGNMTYTEEIEREHEFGRHSY